MEEQLYYSLDDVVNRLQVSKPSVYKWIREGKMPEPIKLGKMRWSKDRIEQWMKENFEQNYIAPKQ